jgi:hypothetical protein
MQRFHQSEYQLQEGFLWDQEKFRIFFNLFGGWQSADDAQGRICSANMLFSQIFGVLFVMEIGVTLNTINVRLFRAGTIMFATNYATDRIKQPRLALSRKQTTPIGKRRFRENVFRHKTESRHVELRK